MTRLNHQIITWRQFPGVLQDWCQRLKENLPRKMFEFLDDCWIFPILLWVISVSIQNVLCWKVFPLKFVNRFLWEVDEAPSWKTRTIQTLLSFLLRFVLSSYLLLDKVRWHLVGWVSHEAWARQEDHIFYWFVRCLPSN